MSPPPRGTSASPTGDGLRRSRDSLGTQRPSLIGTGPSHWTTGPIAVMYRQQRALTLARTGDPVRAVAEAEDLTQGDQVSGGSLYDAACVCALSSAGVIDDAKRQESYAARAVAMLRRAQATGYFRDMPARATSEAGRRPCRPAGAHRFSEPAEGVGFEKAAIAGLVTNAPRCVRRITNLPKIL